MEDQAELTLLVSQSLSDSDSQCYASQVTGKEVIDCQVTIKWLSLYGGSDPPITDDKARPVISRRRHGNGIASIKFKSTPLECYRERNTVTLRLSFWSSNLFYFLICSLLKQFLNFVTVIHWTKEDPSATTSSCQWDGREGVPLGVAGFPRYEVFSLEEGVGFGKECEDTYSDSD